MRKVKANVIINMVAILLFFIILHDAIIIALGNLFTLFRDDNKSELELSAYKEKIDILESSIADYERSLENLSIYDGSSYVLAKIALRDVYDFYDVISIAVDSKVKKGDAVINEEGLVGIVSDVNKYTATVDMLTGKIKISVKVGNSFGIIDEYDKKENRLIIHNINNYADIEDGSLVETSGLQEIDAGIKIGEVTSSKIVGVEKIVYVEPAVDFSNLNYLMVIDK